MFFWGTGLAAARAREKGKGCDIGYALAISSCEEANSVEACTVTALDAITAFAVPNPNSSSQSRRFFQVWLPVGLPDGMVWYVETGLRPNRLVGFDPKTRAFAVPTPIPSGGGVVRNMVATPDGKLYLACSGVNKVGVAEVLH